MFLNTTATVSNWNAAGNECSLILEENPLTEFVQLPEQLQNLHYSNILCGVIRGALDMVNIEVECSFAKDVLCGDNTTEIHLKFIEAQTEQYPFKDDD